MKYVKQGRVDLISKATLVRVTAKKKMRIAHAFRPAMRKKRIKNRFWTIDRRVLWFSQKICYGIAYHECKITRMMSSYRHDLSLFDTSYSPLMCHFSSTFRDKKGLSVPDQVWPVLPFFPRWLACYAIFGSIRTESTLIKEDGMGECA